MKRRMIGPTLAALLLIFGFGCQTQHKVETVHKIEVAPMHITLDVNVRVDKAVDEFFGDIDAAEDKIIEQQDKTKK